MRYKKIKNWVEPCSNVYRVDVQEHTTRIGAAHYQPAYENFGLQLISKLHAAMNNVAGTLIT
jgi:hypothetical protein